MFQVSCKAHTCISHTDLVDHLFTVHAYGEAYMND